MKHWYGSDRSWRNRGRTLYNRYKWLAGRASGAALGFIQTSIPGAVAGWELGGALTDWSGYYPMIKHNKRSKTSWKGWHGSNPPKPVPITGSNPGHRLGSNPSGDKVRVRGKLHRHKGRFKFYRVRARKNFY